MQFSSNMGIGKAGINELKNLSLVGCEETMDFIFFP